MSDRADALRYARELFDITWRQGKAEEVAAELETIVRAARDYQSQVRPLFHPLVPKASKLATIRAFTSKAGVSRPTAVLLEALVQYHALHLLGVVAGGFRDRLNRKLGVVRARVTTATPLAAEKAEALRQRLSEVSGRQVTLGMHVDPAIIGGVVTQIDSTVYDGSVTRQLARMRQKLVENV
jgi:F-type H+-transporting ATPase subunit delta